VALAFVFYSASKSRVSAVAEVNGVKITRQDINEIALTVPPSLKETVTGSDLLEQAINFEIVRQEARKIGITITDEEVEDSIDYSLQQAGLTREDLLQSVKQQKLDWNTLFNAYKKQLLSLRFMNETIMKDISVEEDEVRAFYEEYSELVSLPYEDVRDDISNTLLIAKSQQILGEWLEQKRAEYEIVRYA